MIFDFARASAGCKRIKDASYKTLRLSLVNQGRVVQSRVKITQGLRSKFSFILSANNLMIGCYKKKRGNYLGKYF